jgi:hypothetical protein
MAGTAMTFAGSVGGLVAVTVTPVDIPELATDPAPARS